MNAGETERFGAAGLAAVPPCGDSLQAGSVAPASETATPDDAPRSKSLRDNPPENLELVFSLMIRLRIKIGRTIYFRGHSQT
jgi:hypothetical protein